MSISPVDRVVEWVWPSTNIITGVAQTNHLYLEDDMIGITNLVLTTNGIGPAQHRIPADFHSHQLFLLPMQDRSSLALPPPPACRRASLAPTPIWTTEYTAYEALFEPTTVIVGEVAGQTYTNMPGRIEITADKQLDLSSSRIAGLNYLRLTAHQQFYAGSQYPDPDGGGGLQPGGDQCHPDGQQPAGADLPAAERIRGRLQHPLDQHRLVANAHPQHQHVFRYDGGQPPGEFVAERAPEPDLARARNVVISDVLNVLSNITIDAYNVMITTNGPGAQTPAGQLNFPSGQPLGASALPRLRTLTNYGVISVQNAATFGSSSQPLWDFVNHGSVLAQGCSIWATNFENTGLVDAGPGPINLTATSAVLSNGVFNAPFNNITLSAGSLLISNQVLNAGHNLTI